MSANGAALSEVFVEHRAQLRRIALKIVGVQLADEVMQEAYIKVAVGACARPVDKPYCYCCQVVRNLARDYRRRQTVEAAYRVYTVDGELPPMRTVDTPEGLFREQKLLECVERALGQLPQRTRHAFELYRLSGLTQREIARELGCSATLVNFMLKDAVDALAACREIHEEN